MLAYGLQYKLMRKQVHGENQTAHSDRYLGKEDYNIFQVYKYKTSSGTGIRFSGNVFQLFDIRVVCHTITSSRHNAPLFSNDKEQLVLPWFLWTGIPQNSAFCHDSSDQEYHRTAGLAMIPVISDIKEQHVLPWILWSGIFHTFIYLLCVHQIHTRLFVYPLEKAILFFHYRFIFTPIKLGII